MNFDKGTEPSTLERLNGILDLVQSAKAQGNLAYTALFPETARTEAADADRREAASRKTGPLDGLLVSVKSLLDVAGVVTAAGSVTLQDRPPADEDCLVVSRLREAGAVIVGATQMTEFAFSAVGSNPNFPALGNPRDRDRIPGGSSSGAAVSIGEALADIAIGSDTGGSLRIPAALCGLVGFKPTAARVPRAGAFALSPTLDTIGPIANTVELCAAADAVISGGTSDVAAADIDGFRLIVARGRLFAGCEAAVADAFDAAMDQLRHGGVRVEEGSLEWILADLSEIDAIGTFPSVELAATLLSMDITDLARVDPNTRARIEAGSGLPAVDYLRMARLRDQAVALLESTMTDDEVYVVPTVPITAPLVADVAVAEAFHETNGLLLRNPRVANLLDCPSISLPVPAQGLPVGMMLIGRRYADRRLLSIASRLENILQSSELVSARG